MKVEIELINGKVYRVSYKEGFDFFMQEVVYATGNSFLKSEDGTYIATNKIVRFNILEG